MPKPLDGKNALVTGASRGIGRAIAQRLAADGATVAIGYANRPDAADQVAAAITADGGTAFPLPAPLGTHGDAAALWAAYDRRITAHTTRTGVDIIVNNAAIGRSPDLHTITETQFDELFATNVRAPLFIVQQAHRRLHDNGRIINISSGTARLAMPDIMAYGATKGALDTLTLNLAQLLGPRNITVNSLAPGIVDTDTNAAWLRDDPDAQAWASSLAALGRVGRPDDIAGIAAFLASDDARWVTGRTIDATGGALLGV
ncbi:SDR family oxidoreductase [Nocardiopsis composta]|uniref:NAD(P)-dependent dehydrogenase (Short-subunit alcohol dehydrogenase family) n=1 Tax=Nocardiopsis composta TaxID=157465 RepID=A0A7W8QJ13_9ACTN|nr:SDR family oxidoreductase [Nocardiopsis composta]MBB5430371.1 NAD(P)-dependent dehydrogenase (short-subunit alcohol dehydrogenase family) [Nocardiopsis composta]